MIRTVVACTNEVDDENLAVAQIKEQLNLDANLMKNAIGIIACHNEFVMSGVVKALGEALPFELVGAISTIQSTQQQMDSLLLSVMLITGDDVEFVTAVTPSLASEPAKVIAETYTAATSGRAERPALILPYAPFMLQNSGDGYVNTLTEVSGGTPCFGTLATDDSDDFSTCYTIYNGECFLDKMVITCIYGNISPKFYVANISADKVFDKSAIVTKSEGHVIMELNERPVTAFFEDMGLTKASATQYAMTSLPFLLDYHDGTPMVSKIFIHLTPENYALCAGAVPEGSTMHVTTNERDDILLTTEQALDQALKNVNASGILIYSCVARSMTMGSDQFAEASLVNQTVTQLPFLMAYSGGEICPTTISNDNAINRFHNNAFVACVF
ncbi:MAG: FIST C-terminal domain-containing protein [Defluviitaleaceae bacterium]|nr:FIST C-terminal domain-containing protein [Defluviitaleaceae bacterium]